FDGIMFVGHHGREGGATRTIINHTLSSAALNEIRINNDIVGETEMNAKVASFYDVPAIFASEDHAYCKEIKETLPLIKVVEGKKCIDRYAAELISPKKARNIIKEQAKKAIYNIPNIKINQIEEPVTFTLNFKLSSQALMTTTI